ncbi:MAG: dTDP-glucose 4,6-dehydratase [Alphaproteobacteria bacterium]|mgnify:CR=1 FL=1|nr:dTDP-glucose 4,6-dehydratase [Alphaproteobacteria bacterium]|tara:strand:- start:2968 stop:4014 length:1047 start_codon:yes stop_codon:yes gene_type:complete
MTWLVTGGAGFIGSALCHHLAEASDDKILVIDKLTYAGNRASLAELEKAGRVELIVEDITHADSMKEIVRDAAPKAIFHLAAETHVDRSIDGPGAFIATNVSGTYSMLEAARAFHAGLPDEDKRAFRFIHISTDEVFGSLGQEGSFCETTPYAPSSPYSASKAGSDHLARAWFHTFGLPVIVSNCSNNYGPRQFPEKLIPLMILKCLSGENLPVYGRGANVRDWLHTEDHARALLMMAQNGVPGETYCVGGGAERTNIEIVNAICGIMDDRCPESAPHNRLIEFVMDRPGHDFRYAIDSSKINNSLGWAPFRDFETGLAETIDWYLDNEAWWRPVQQSVYGGERLGKG